MTTSRISFRVRSIAVIGVVLAVGLWSLSFAGAASAASVLSGPINLGTSASYGVLASSSITNTGPTVVTGDIGVSPQSSITGFAGAPNGSFSGVENDNDTAAAHAQSDLTTAFNAAAGLTPISSGLTELNGMSLTPGVYSGGALSLSNNGTLTLAGTSPNSVWVFQAASSLTIGSATQIVITGGATACNVFWEVGSSASIGTSAHFQGTVLAAASITAATGATVAGRLLASTAAVTLQSNTITVPPGCAAGSAPTTTNSPAITSGLPTAATQGTPYAFGVTASGTPSPVFAVSSGSLPSGLAIDSTTGMISGVPTGTGSSTFTVTASSSTAPAVSEIFTIVVAAETLASTGVNVLPPLLAGSVVVLLGATILVARRRRFFAKV